MNLNRLFPRLSITAKLAIAFVLLALGPLLLVTAMGTFSTVQQMRARERELLEHDLETVGQRTAHTLGELVQQVDYLGRFGLDEVVVGGPSPEPDWLVEAVRTYLSTELSDIFRIKVVNAAGETILEVGADGASQAELAQPYYAWLASELEGGDSRLVPVELRGGADEELVAAVAVVRAVRSPVGTLRGALVAEARAADVFDGIDRSSPGAAGVTAVVDQDGHFLYHSVRKRDWATLLARRSEIGMTTDLPEDATDAILSGRIGTVRSVGGVVTTFRPLSAAGLSVSPFFLYRTFPQATLGASVRSYLAATGMVAALVFLSVLAAAVVAARQLTRPLHRLQEAARRVTSGEVHEALEIETNDEIQDLAEDFEIMAAEVGRHRLRLEAAVEERTRSLHRAEAELSRIVSMSADAIVGLDAGGFVRLWNRGAQNLFGYTTEEAIGADLSALILPEGPRSRQEESYLRRKVAESGAVIGYQTVRRTKSGEEIPVGLTHTVLTDESGEVVGSSVVVRDNRMNEQVQESMRRSERLAAVSLMAAGLAHELNNPVAILGNRIALMQRDLAAAHGDERIRRDLAVLRQHVARLGAITGDLLRFARDETEVVRPVQVNEIVERVVRLLDRMLAAQGVALERTVEEELPCALASGAVVETTLVNLVLNAQQASPAGGTVTISTRARRAHGRVEVEVRDTGPGVPRELRHRIFEPFFTTKADHGGTGLGLAVCRALMERQGGTIHLAPDNGGGAVFVLSFQTVPRTER